MAATGGSDPTNGRCFTLGSILYIYIYKRSFGRGGEKKRFVFIVKFVYVNRRRLLVES